MKRHCVNIQKFIPFTLLKDPAAAQTPESSGTWRMGGTYGHSWFVDPKRAA
ncbi:hypothetical protein [Paenibacillus sp. DMB20]|uniref:hypothetical protein n=1 Tax=Paenibacillus sp. DMB20 TaxID=1642570 RepID=UPI000ADC17B3|nr:hypothetical protein [Paenibacillus sp. DMB20]